VLLETISAVRIPVAPFVKRSDFNPAERGMVKPSVNTDLTARK